MPTKGLRKSWTDPNHTSVTFANAFHTIKMVSENPETRCWFHVYIYEDETAYDNSEMEYHIDVYDISSSDGDYASYFTQAEQAPLNTTLLERAYWYLQSLSAYSGAVVIGY